MLCRLLYHGFFRCYSLSPQIKRLKKTTVVNIKINTRLIQESFFKDQKIKKNQRKSNHRIKSSEKIKSSKVKQNHELSSQKVEHASSHENHLVSQHFLIPSVFA